MPLPKPGKSEKKEVFLNRCMSNDRMKSEHKENNQRLAVCSALWKNKRGEDMTIERRYTPGDDAEIRVKKTDDGKKKLRGYFAKFGNLSRDLGGFKEVIEKGFFRDAIENSDTVDLFNHDANFILGRKSAGTLRIWEDDTGLAYECEPPDTQLIRDLVLTPIERGDIKGNSFGFRIKLGGDSWAHSDEDGLDIRTLKAGGCEMLIDGSQVVHPAYEGTDVALRSLKDWRDDEQRKTDEERKASMANHARKAQCQKRRRELELLELETEEV